MKKVLTLALGATLVLSSCDTYTGVGAVTGAQFGNVIGSAIGGITGGWRGSDWGSLIGTAAGAAAGAAIGAAVDQSQQQKYDDYAAARAERRSRQTYERSSQRSTGRDYGYNNSGEVFDPTNSGDDRIAFDMPVSEPIVIRRAELTDANGDGVLKRGEECTVRFEIMNNSDKTVYDICPMVDDITGNKHVHVSQNLRIESIAPHQGVRYSATILADNRLKDGEVHIRVGVMQGNKEITSQTREFRLVTRKR
jgi:hypothetical protein